MRETLFSILLPALAGSVFVDAYAGTGAVGIEALSRGAHSVVLIENNRPALEVIQRNLKNLKIEGKVRVLKGTVAAAGKEMQQADIVFADPPYTREREYGALFETLAAHPPPLVVVQHSIRLELNAAYGQLERTRKLKQGENALSFYARREATAD